MHELTVSENLSVARRDWIPSRDASTNKSLYGTTASPEGVGCNLRVTLGAVGANREELSARLLSLKKQFDHTCLFEDVDVFRARSSTLERVTQHWADQIFGTALSAGDWSYLRVQEGENLFGCVRPQSRDQVELSVSVSNLRLNFKGPPNGESGLLVRRSAVVAAVAASAREFGAGNPDLSERDWSEKLFISLKAKLSHLDSLDIDLPSQKSLHVT